MMADDLLDPATLLAQSQSGRPKQANLKRAASTAYYALFHALCHSCVDSFVGWNVRSGHYWKTVTPLYRLIDHGNARRVLDKLTRDRTSSDALRQIALSFIDLQENRLLADYDPEPKFDLKLVRQLIALAQSSIDGLRALPPDERRVLAVQLISKPR